MNKRIEFIVKDEISKYFWNKNYDSINLNNLKDNIPLDLKIYGDDFEELIYTLSKKIDFSFEEFFFLFKKKGFNNLSEFYFPLYKLFYLDFKALLKGKISLKLPTENKKLINVEQLINLIEILESQKKNKK